MQILGRACVTTDVGWFFCSSTTAEIQDGHCDELLDTYFDALLAHGGPVIPLSRTFPLSPPFHQKFR
jgi:hypothetical protein